MDIYELIRSRRSIRAYEPGKNIPDEMLKRILDAGMWSASGKNVQNWRYFVLRGASREKYLAHSQKSWLSIKDVLEKRLKPSLYKFTERFFYTMGDAPVVILAFAEINDIDHPQTQLGNVYLSVQNMVLAAQSEGLGSCVLGSPLEVEADIRAFLGADVHADWKLVCGLTLGYPAHTPPTPPRITEGRVFFLD